MSGYGSRSSGGYGRSRECDSGSSSYEMFVAASDCGKIIGRGGAKIRELQQRTNCKITVSRDDEGNGQRRVDLVGADDAIDLAVDIINQVLADPGDDRGRRSQQQDRYGGMSSYGGGDSKDVIRVDTQYVGRIIGRGGTRIRELQDETGCRINVSRDGGNYGQTDVELIGTPMAIQAAKDRIDDITSTQQAY